MGAGGVQEFAGFFDEGGVAHADASHLRPRGVVFSAEQGAVCCAESCRAVQQSGDGRLVVVKRRPVVERNVCEVAGCGNERGHVGAHTGCDGFAVLAQGKEDVLKEGRTAEGVHLDGGADEAALKAHAVFRVGEDAVPQGSFGCRFDARQVHPQVFTAHVQAGCVVEEEQAEVNQTGN